MLWLVLHDTLNITSLFLLRLEYAEIITDFIVLQVCNLPGIRMYNDFYSFKVISSILIFRTKEFKSKKEYLKLKNEIIYILIFIIFIND